jgi:hypothetical protein
MVVIPTGHRHPGTVPAGLRGGFVPILVAGIHGVVRSLSFVLALHGCGGSFVGKPSHPTGLMVEAQTIAAMKPDLNVESAAATLALTLETRSGIAREGCGASHRSRASRRPALS